MASIDELIANSGRTQADWGAIPGIAKSYWEGKDQQFKNDQRDVFKNGVPLAPDGQPDFAAIGKVLFQSGNLEGGIKASDLDLQRQNLRFGQVQSGDIRSTEGGAPPSAVPIVSPPSTNRSGETPVAPALPRGAPASPAAAMPGQQGGDQPGSIVGMVSAAGIPEELAGPVIAQISAMTKTDPNVALPQEHAARVQQVVQAAAQRMRGGQQPQVAQAQPQPSPPQQSGPLPTTNPVTSTSASPAPSRTDQMIAYYAGIMSDPRSPKQNVELAKTRLEALQKNNELTPSQKEYSQFRLEGGKGTMQDWEADREARKTAATEEAKLGAKKYEAIVENGTKAQMEIPQLAMLQEQMNDPNFFSGSGEKFNLFYKRLKSAVGIDPEAAVPQEYLRKATAANVLSSLGALRGLGQIRVAEINMAREAAASPENSVPANKLLVEISKRTHERNVEIADMAQEYKDKNSVLDAGFDKQVTAYYRKNPLFNDAEIKDWHKVIGEAKTAPGAAGGVQQFSSPADVHAAVAAGKLKKGDSFQDANGKTRFVP